MFGVVIKSVGKQILLFDMHKTVLGPCRNLGRVQLSQNPSNIQKCRMRGPAGVM